MTAAQDRERDRPQRAEHLYGVFMQMSEPNERNRPTEADIQSALTEATRVIDRAESIPF